jgi:Cu/Ag efflux protein CusF
MNRLRTPLILPILIAALGIGVAGCGGSSKVSGPGDGQNGLSEGQTFQAQGRVSRIDGQDLTLQHDLIPNVMPAMLMAYRIPTPEMLTGVRTGQRVQILMVVQHGELVIVSVTPAS